MPVGEFWGVLDINTYAFNALIFSWEKCKLCPPHH